MIEHNLTKEEAAEKSYALVEDSWKTGGMEVIMYHYCDL
jgi:hypothetical protein